MTQIPATEQAVDKTGRAKGALWHYPLVAALAGVIMLWQLGTGALEEHEAKAAITAQSMLSPNDWLVVGALDGKSYEIPPKTEFNRWMVPVQNGLPRLVKTPLQYWLIAAAATANGGVNEFTARLPAATCAVLTVLVTLAFGRRVLTPRAALFGTVMLATSFGFLKWGRSARPEMALCMLTTVAMVCFYLGIEARTTGRRIGWMGAFWLAMAAGNMAKEFVPLLLSWPLLAYLCFWQHDTDKPGDGSLTGLRRFFGASLAGLIIYVTVNGVGRLHWWQGTPLGDEKGSFMTLALCLGLPLAVYFIRTRAWGQVVSLLPTAVPGILVMFGVFLSWMSYMNYLFPSVAGGIFSYQVTDRAAGSGAWSPGSPWFYIFPMFVYLLPWVVFVPGAFAVPLMDRFRAYRRPLIYLFLWTVGVIFLFTAAAGKREHYILPIYPALCLLMGFVAEEVFFNHAWIKPAMSRLIGWGYAMAAPAGIVAIFLAARQKDQRLHLAVVVAIASVPMLVGGLAAIRGRFRPFIALVGVSITLVYIGFYARFGLWDNWAVVKMFSQRAAKLVSTDAATRGLSPADVCLYHWKDPEAQMPYYFGRVVPSIRWQFDRRHDQLLMLGVETDKAAAREDDEWNRWIANPANAPWVADCQKTVSDAGVKLDLTKDRKMLEDLGYKPVLTMRENRRKARVFTLYHRLTGPATSAPATMPAADASKPADN